MSDRYTLTDEQWNKIENLLSGKKGDVGVTAKNNRLFVNAVLHRYRAGCPWRDLPERFGNWKVVRLRHTRWAKKGIWEKVFDTLSQDADNEYAMMDATMVKARQHFGGALGGKKKACIGKSKGGLTTKIHTVCDA